MKRSDSLPKSLTQAGVCDDESLQAFVATISQLDNADALAQLQQALTQWPNDARLHFLYASCLAEARQYESAARSFETAVALEPDFSIARFQLGLLHLTSGRPEMALMVWQGLDQLEQEHPLQLFKQGLTALIEGRMQDCIALLQQGIAANQSYPPLSHDMQLLIQNIASLSERTPVLSSDATAKTVSTTVEQAERAASDKAQRDSAQHLLLSEYLSSNTKH